MSAPPDVKRLERHFVGVTAPMFIVYVRKTGGREIVFARYTTRDEAAHAVTLLRWAGAAARIEEVRRGSR